jgi:hypothetical protein
VIGFFIHGGQITVPQGTIARAKTREAFVPGAPSGHDGVPPPAASTTERISE